MGRVEEKRAAIVAAQAAREAAERDARRAAGLDQPQRARRTNWAASAPLRPRGPGRPKKPGP
jgi:hypothetical protein